VVTASFDNTARVWDAETGELVGEPMRHRADVTSAQFSPDGRLVVTASRDKTARVWEAETGKAAGAPLQSLGEVYFASFSPDSRRVVTASEDYMARIWDVLLPSCATQQEADRLAHLAEAVSAYEVSVTGSVSFLGLEEQRKRFAALRSRRLGSASALSIDWMIDQFVSTDTVQTR
jgi:WD40 repeat protein